MDKERKILSIINPLLLVLTVSGIGIYLFSSYKIVDDLSYCVPLRSWFVAHDAKLAECGWTALQEGFPLDLMKDVWRGHFLGDNGRLGNIFVVFFLLLPKWFGSSVSLFFWVLCMYYSFRLAKVSIRRSYIVAVGVFLWSFQMPWEDWMTALDYQFNYIVPSGIMVWYLTWVRSRKFKGPEYITLIIAGIITGAWHEGFTIPVVVGGIAVLILYPRYRIPRYYIALSGLSVGLLYLVLCPGTVVRLMGHTQAVIHSALLMAQLLFSHVTYLILFIWGILEAKRYGMRGLQPLIVFGIVSATVAIVIQIATNGVPRGGWWADLISIICIMNLLRNTTPSAFWRHPYIRIPVYALFSLLAIGHWVAVDYYALESRHLYEQVLSAYETKKQRVAFVKERTARDLPLICMWTPNLRVFKEPWSLMTMRAYYQDYESEEFLTVIPENLRMIRDNSGEEMPGGSAIRRKDGFLFMKSVQGNVLRVRGDVNMSTGLKGEQWFDVFRFRSEGDGEEYLYLYPIDRNWKVLIGEIESIENVEVKSF